MDITRTALTGALVSSIAACTGYIDTVAGTAPPPPPPPSQPPPPADAGSRQLDIQPRQQIDPAGGYSAETSIQTIGLSFGVYLSQAKLRTTAGAPIVLGDNAATVLDTFHLTYEAWDTTKAPPQSADFLAWTKGHIESGVPVIYGVYSSTATTPQTTYDDVLPAIAIAAMTPAVFDGSDTLTSSDNDGGKVERTTGTLSADRAGCQKPTAGGGCVPLGVDYGMAMLGIADAKHAALPVSIRIDVDPEPNEIALASYYSDGAVPVNATVVASGLTAGQAYSLLRYDDDTTVPTDTTAADMLASAAYAHRYDFVASDVTFLWRDPDTFQSDGTAYYRCVPR